MRLLQCLFSPICLALVFLSINTNAQTTVFGTVRDAKTGVGLNGVELYQYHNDSSSVLSDSFGNFVITLPSNTDTLIFSYLGYDNDTVKVTDTQHLTVFLNYSQTNLDEVVITVKRRRRYRNKNNPAVALIRHVIQHKEENKLTHFNFVQYRQYEKLQMGTSNTPKYIKRLPFFRKFSFVFENIDSTSYPGKAVVPLYIEETLSDVYIRNQPQKTKTIIKAKKRIALSGRYIDSTAINAYMSHLYKDVDIYKNNINIITNEFLSPIADAAPTFYKFYIIDTIKADDGTQLIELDFIPRNKHDFLFSGTMYITLDGHYGVQQVKMRVGKEVNMNWVKDVNINLDFKRGSDNHFYQNRSAVRAYFSLLNGKRGLYADRTVAIDHFKTPVSIADSIFEGAQTEVTKTDSTFIKNKQQYWEQNRIVPLTSVEAKTYNNVDSMIHMKAFKTGIDIINTIASGYKNFPKIELGSIYSLYSYNNLEGSRFRLGFRTTDKFNRNVMLDGYGAYGIKDNQLKYLLRGAYSFSNKPIFSFPQNFFRIGYQHDVMVPGQQFQFAGDDNIVMSFSRGVNNKFFYLDKFKAEYILEFGNIMGIQAQFAHQDLKAAGALNYIKQKDGITDTVRHITTSDIGLQWSWSPHAEIVQNIYTRTLLNNKYPTFTLNLNLGVKGLWNAQYNYQSIRLSIAKRQYLSQLGYADIKVNGGYMYGKLPYPLLYVPLSNQTYLYKLAAYNLMNNLEFVNDHFAELQVDYHMMGFILNKIPLLKKLGLREVANFKMLYGGLRNENNPTFNPNLFVFPKDEFGNPSTFIMGSKPYIEASVGLENILNILRIDVIRRFTYINNPNVSKWGVRGYLYFDF